MNKQRSLLSYWIPNQKQLTDLIYLAGGKSYLCLVAEGSLKDVSICLNNGPIYLCSHIFFFCFLDISLISNSILFCFTSFIFFYLTIICLYDSRLICKGNPICFSTFLFFCFFCGDIFWGACLILD